MATMNANEWYLTKLRTITTKIGSGATPRGGKNSYKKDGITLIRSLNVYDFKFEHNGLAFIDEDQAEKLSNVEIHQNDILLNITGASVARCCMVPARLLPARVNQHVAIVRVNPTVADPHFILYCINSLQYKHHLLTLAQGGATREALTKDTIGDFEIALLSLSTQHKIAAVLSAYDDLIENNTRRIKILEEMAQALYREWFVKFRFPGHEKVKMVESELGMVPEGWEVKKLKDICSHINYGYTASAKKESIGPKFLRITDIVPYLIDWDSVPHCEITEERLNKYKLVEGDIVIARTGATTGYAKRINKNHPETVFASYLVRLRINSEFSNRLFGLVIESEEYKNFIKSNLGGAAQPQANAQILTSMLILVPSKRIQISFDKIVSDFMDNREGLQKKNLNLRRTRDLLLPKLISGEVDVENIDVQMPNNGGA